MEDKTLLMTGLIIGGIIGLIVSIYTFSKDHHNNPKNKK